MGHLRLGLGLTSWCGGMCVGRRKIFRELVGGGLTGLSVYVVPSFSRLLTLAVTVAILAEGRTLHDDETVTARARELTE